MYPPQRVFVRESVVENLRLQLVLGVTKTTIDLYQKSFGQRYPFSKIDHVMCPDYKYGAMEIWQWFISDSQFFHCKGGILIS